MAPPLTLWLNDRSRYKVGTGRCFRQRYLGYHWGPTGYGITTKRDSLPLATGIYVHEGLQDFGEILQREDRLPTLEETRAIVAEVCAEYVRRVEAKGFLGILASDHTTETITEQSCLISGILWALRLKFLPWLHQAYRVLSCELERLHQLSCTCGAGPLPAAEHIARGCYGKWLMLRNDLIAQRRGATTLAYFEAKTTGWESDAWADQWESDPQLGLGTLDAQQTWGAEVTELFIIGLQKGARRRDKSEPEGRRKQLSALCLVPTTRVLTHDLRWVPIGSLQEGDQLAAFDEEASNEYGRQPSRSWRSATVSAIGVKTSPCLRVLLSDGTSVTCTHDHLWLTTWQNSSSGAAETIWRSAKELRPQNIWGSRASRIFKPLPVWEVDNSYAAGYLSGLLDGEGFLARSRSKGSKIPKTVLGFSQKPGLVMDRATALFHALGVQPSGPYNPHAERSSTSLQITRRSDVLSILGRVRPQRLLDKLDLNQLGILRSDVEAPIVVSVEDVGHQVVVPIETSTRTLIAEGLASHNCYGYLRPGNPPLVADDWLPTYEWIDDNGELKRASRAHKRAGIWLLEGSDYTPWVAYSRQDPSLSPAEFWVRMLPASVIEKVCFLLGPMNRQDHQIASVRASMIGEEDRWQQTLWQLYEAQQQHPWASPEFQHTLDTLIPQSWNCRPFGRDAQCEMYGICHKEEGWQDPLGSGLYVPRRPHHEAELEQAIARGLLPPDAEETEGEVE